MIDIAPIIVGAVIGTVIGLAVLYLFVIPVIDWYFGD